MLANQAIQLVALTIVLTLASLWDVRYRTIPGWMPLVIVAIALLDFQPQNIWGCFIAIPLWLGALWEEDGKESIGGGDIKLVAATGLVLGFWSGLLGLVLGLICFIVYGRYTKATSKPMVPALSLGFIIPLIL